MTHDQSKTPLATLRFNAAKLLQTDINAWKGCGHKPCKERQACLGGPRGTCRRTGGWPACTREGSDRLSATARGSRWKRTSLYDSETSAERGLRMINEEILREQAKMSAANIRNTEPPKHRSPRGRV